MGRGWVCGSGWRLENCGIGACRVSVVTDGGVSRLILM